VDKDINIWKQRNEILHKKVNRQMDEIKNLNEKGETIFDLARKYPNKTYKELEAYREADRQQEAQQIIIPEDEVAKEADALMINKITKYEGRIEELQKEIDRVKKENNDLFLRIAELTEVEESHRRMNGKLQERLSEVEEDNKKLARQIEDKINQLRRSGL